MLRRTLIVLMIVALCVPMVAQAQSKDDPKRILLDIKAKLGQADSLFNGKRPDDMIKAYQDALDLIRANKDKPIFTKDTDILELHQDEYRAVTGLGRSNLGRAAADYMSTNYYYPLTGRAEANDWFWELNETAPFPFWCPWNTEGHEHPQQLDDAISNLEASLELAKSLPEPVSPGREWTYLSLATAYLDRSAEAQFTSCFQDGEKLDYKAFEYYSQAVDAFVRVGNGRMAGVASNSKGELAASYMTLDSFQGKTREEWFKVAVDSLQQAIDGLYPGGRQLAAEGFQSVRPLELLNFLLFAFEQQLENGAVKKSPFSVEELRQRQVKNAEQLGTIYTAGEDWEQAMFRGLANAQVAWRTKDANLARRAVQDLLAGSAPLTSKSSLTDSWRTLDKDYRPFASSANMLLVYEQHSLGRMYTLIGERPDLALQSLQDAEQTASEKSLWIDWPYGVPWTDTAAQYDNDWLIGVNLTTLGHYREAVQKFQDMNRITDFTKQPVYPNVMLGLSTAYQKMGMYYESLDPLRNRQDFYTTALQSASDDSQKKEFQTDLINNNLLLSIPLAVVGRTEEALTRLQQAVDQAKGLNDSELLVNTTLRVGDIYLQLESEENAFNAYKQAADLAEAAKLPLQQGQALLGLGRLQVTRKLFKDALDSLTKANQALQTAQDAEGQINALIALGDLALLGDSADNATAEKDYRQALDIGNKAGNLRLSVEALRALGDLQAKMNLPVALLTYYRALVAARSVDNREGLSRLFARIGQLVSKDQPDQAIDAYANAVATIEQAQRGFQSESLTSQFAANYAWIYADYIKLLFSQKRYEQAFDVTERARARAFLDQLAIGPVDLKKGASADLLDQETALRQLIDATQDLLARAQSANPPDQDYVNKLLTTLRKAESDYGVLFTRMQAEGQSVASLAGVQVASLPKVQAGLDPDTTLLSFYTTDVQTYAFIVTANSFDALALDVNSDQLRDAVARFRGDTKAGAGLDDLDKWLILPLADHLHTSRLVIVPHSVLNYAPFAALPVQSDQAGTAPGVLGDKFAISYLPSATTLLYLAQRPKQGGKVLALGNPTAEGFVPLPFAETEVKDVVALTGGDVFLRADAKESLIWDRASQSNVLYLAAHGTFNARNPLFSAIQLTPGDGDNGRLEAYKVYSLDLTQATDLVVLSACDTALGTLSAGDEFTGLNRAFLYAGTPAVIASLWSVDDQATALLMKAFFEGRLKGMGNADALQAAQASIRNYKDSGGNRPYVSPYYWAAFILTGRG